MRSTLWPDARVKPPFGSVTVDWGHPLARNLLGVWLVNEGAGKTLHAVDRPEMSVSVNAGATTRFEWYGTPQGLTVKRTAGSGHFVLPTLPSSDLHSAIAGIRWNATGWQALIGEATTDNYLGFDWHGSLRSYPLPDTATIMFTPNVAYKVAWTLSLSGGSGTGNYYVDGVKDVGGTGTFDPFVPARIGDDGSNEAFGGWLSYVMYWQRVLSDDEGRWLTVEPFAFLKPLVRRKYFFLGAVAGKSASRQRRSTLWPDRQVKPTPGTVEIDRAHPLARGLTFAYYPTHSFDPDLVTGKHPTLTGTLTGRASDRYGPSIYGIGSYATFAADARYTASGACTALMAVKPDNTYYTEVFQVMVGANQQFLMFFHTGPLLRLEAWQAGNVADGTTPSLNWSLVGFWNDGTNTQFFQNGVATSLVAHTPTFQTDPWRIDVGEYGGLFNAAVALAVMWNRKLTNAEVKQFYDEPFAFLRPIVRRRYFVLGQQPESGQARLMFARWRGRR